MELSFKTAGESETQSLGEKISSLLQQGDVVCLFGDLGSGKTCLVRGICRGYGCENEVTSPTFTIINEYNGKHPIFHFDLYRINSVQEIFDLGYEEYFFGSGICLIEWAERAETILPEENIKILMSGIFEQGKENIRNIKIILSGVEINHRSWKTLLQNSLCSEGMI